MRKIIVTEYISIDGVFEEPGHWSFDWWNDEAAKYKYDELFESDLLLLGRKTYEGFAKAWPTMEGTGEFGERMNNIQKYVVSKTLKNADWNNTIIINDDIINKIKELKQKEGQNILIAGSATLVEALMKEDLIDEYRFILHPVILGSGKKFFKQDSNKKNLELIQAKTFATGIVVLHYK